MMRSSALPPPPEHRNATETNALLSHALADTLEKTGAHGIPLYLTGGTAVAAVAGTRRPLSLDLDFFVEPDSTGQLRDLFGGSFTTFDGKPLFKSHKLVGTSGGVDLDFIAEQSIVPDEAQRDQRITLRITPHILQHALQTRYLGSRVTTLPPEYVLIAKLFAGRGTDLGKYDLVDCKSLLDAGVIRSDVLEQAIRDLSQGNPATMELMQRRLSQALSAIPDAKDVHDIQRIISSLTREVL